MIRDAEKELATQNSGMRTIVMKSLIQMRFVVTARSDRSRLGQILDPRDAFRGISNIPTGSNHSVLLVAQFSPPPNMAALPVTNHRDSPVFCATDSFFTEEAKIPVMLV